jgi:hypothetical protein
MAATFNCPQCGAPINFEPQPGDTTVQCAFCNETVVIPKDLRIPAPRKQPIQTPPPRSNRTAIIIFGTIAGFVALCVVIGILVDRSDSSSIEAATDTPYFVSSDATSTVEAKATTAALQPLFKREQAWPVVFSDNFTDNKNKWETGDVRSDYITGNRAIANGVYTWNVTSLQGASDFSTPVMPIQTNFYASVDIKFDLMPDDPDADAGLFFRNNDTDRTWYYFSISPQGQYYFGWYDGSNWEALIPETDSSASRPGRTNRISVGVQGSQFIFAINGQMVDHFVDENLKEGTIGVGINLPKTSEKGKVRFSNFSVLAPASNP